MSGIQNLGYDSSEKLSDEHIGMTSADIPVGPDISNQAMNKKVKKILKIIIINSVFVIYFTFAIVKFFERIENNKCETFDCKLTFCSPYGMLIFLTAVVYLGLIYFKIIKKYFGNCIDSRGFESTKKIFETQWFKYVLITVCFGGLAVYIAFETFSDFRRLRSLIGIFSIVAICFIFSAHRKQIKWRPVVVGSLLQFLLGIFCIRWSVGRMIFQCFGDKIAQFLDYAKEGATFVYSDFLVIEKEIFAFAVLPTIFFFSLCISVLYYLGTMQWVLLKLGWILQSLLGTTVCESVNAAGNIFLGMTEGPLIIKPYINLLTSSEIHAVMVSGFATVSGTVLAAYISFGAEAQHLITASVMAAPASLFISKLMWPETEESKTSSGNIQMEKSSDSSVLDAASNGASQGINLVLNIIANLVAFVAFIAFIDGILKWSTYLLGFDDVDIQFIVGKIFIPVSWAIGIDWVDCEAVGNVIGTKTIVNEFVAYRVLGEYKRAGTISLRSSAIATYAICGFANPSSMGILIGALSALSPTRRPTITKVAFRAFISGCFVSLITASIAGLLMTDEMIENT